MDYNQQRRSRGNYGYRRPAGYGQMASSRNDCGCSSAPVRTDCDCNASRSSAIDMGDYALGMAYIPWQQWNQTYDPHRALMSGTIFPELDKPFCAAGRCNR